MESDTRGNGWMLTSLLGKGGSLPGGDLRNSASSSHPVPVLLTLLSSGSTWSHFSLVTTTFGFNCYNDGRRESEAEDKQRNNEAEESKER